MKSTMKLLAVAVMLLVTLNPQASVSANGLEFKGRGAEAHFFSTDGCIATSVLIELGEDALYSIAIQQRDTCEDLTLLEAYGNKPLSKSELKYTGNLKSAELNTTVTVTDYWRDISFDVTIDLEWTGTGDIRTSHDNYNYSPTSGCHVNILLKESARDARASGTVSASTTNFTSEPSNGGRLYIGKRVETSEGCE